jgi:hypothetical protein
VQQFYKYNRPIWIFEFAASGTEDEQISFLQAVLPWLDSEPNVERYAYFGDFPGFLANQNGDGLSKLGQVYATYSGLRVCGLFLCLASFMF